MRHSQIEISKVINWPVGIDHQVCFSAFDEYNIIDVYLSDIITGVIYAAD